ncbi:zinc-binding dehydrogenase [Nocardiopsis sediminis]|uniref:Zinc-binding dehydrogenase n=1 Tax=Nocardiopsis sediminis TaxID=1778267 RepID=A0ABV8FK38_9ACTN
MRAVEVARFGEPEVLAVGEVADPVAGDGQVVIATEVADVLFLDVKLRQGWGGEYFPLTPPYIPGAGVVGRVRSVGGGVDPAWVGRRVAASTIGFSGYAEQALAPVEGLAAVPDELEPAVAAALTHDGRTAMGVFDRAPASAGDNVLVIAAAGGLGIALDQLAGAAGGRVIAAARGERKLDLARELGAAEAVDYSGPGWIDRVRAATGGAGLDIVYDGAGGELGGAAFAATADGGVFSAHGLASGQAATVDPAEAERRGITMLGIQDASFGPAEGRRLMERAFTEAAKGHLRPVIGATFPLDKAAEAHAAVESREVVGKTLLVV